MLKEQYKDISQPVNELVDLVYNHFGKTPMGWTGVDKLVEYAHNEQFVERVLSLYDYVSSNETLITGINPSQYYKIIYKFQLASKSLSYDIDLLTNCYLYLANYAIRVYNTNIEQIKVFLASHNLFEVSNDEIKTNILFLCALLRSYSETIYCDEHTIAGEVYCPIDYHGGVVIVRKYHMLNAKDLYPELRNCTFQGINIYIGYDKLLQGISTDIVGNLLVKENLSSFLKSYYVEIVDLDGSKFVAEYDEISELISYFRNIVPKLTNKYKSMSTTERIWKKIECEYYALKPFLDIIGDEWAPKKYKIQLDKIQDPLRPIVHLNNMIALNNDECEIKKILFELNNPKLHMLY